MFEDRLTTPALQKIARDLISDCLPWVVTDEQRAELVTSLIRQWRTCGGRAAIFGPDHKFWFQLHFPDEQSTSVEVHKVSGNLLLPFLDDWHIDPQSSDQIIERLNLGQSAEFLNTAGERLRIWVDPTERSINIAAAPADMPDH